MYACACSYQGYGQAHPEAAKPGAHQSLVSPQLWCCGVFLLYFWPVSHGCSFLQQVLHLQTRTEKLMHADSQSVHHSMLLGIFFGFIQPFWEGDQRTFARMGKSSGYEAAEVK